MYFDSHCHLDFPAFDADRQRLVLDAQRAGVDGWFIPGVSPAQWLKLPGLCRQFSGSCFGVGLHPYWVDELSDSELDAALAEMTVAVDSGAVAIGECGLDRPSAKRHGTDLGRQCRVLERQLKLAVDLRLPVVLHIVAAHGKALELLARFGRLAAGGVIHSYSGSAELVSSYLAHGLCFGIGGAITHPERRRLREAAVLVPEERLLLETDAPDQPPRGVEGRNEPKYLLNVAEELSRLLHTPLTTLAERSRENARRLYRLDSETA